MSSEGQMAEVTVEYQGCRRELESKAAKAAMVVTSCEGKDGDVVCLGSFNVQALVNLAYGAVEMVLKIAARLGVDSNAARGLIITCVLDEGRAASVEEKFGVDFNARDEIARIAEDLGVDAEV